MTMFGLSGDDWSAVESLVAIATFLLTAAGLVKHKRSNGRREDEVAPIEPKPPPDRPEWPPEIRLQTPPAQVRLRRIDSGSKLLDLIGPAMMYQLDNEEPTSAEEADVVANALRSIHDWAEADSDINPGDRVRAGFELTQLIEELAEAGWSIYAASRPRQLVVAGSEMNWPTAIVHLARSKRAAAA